MRKIRKVPLPLCKNLRRIQSAPDPDTSEKYRDTPPISIAIPKMSFGGGRIRFLLLCISNVHFVLRDISALLDPSLRLVIAHFSSLSVEAVERRGGGRRHQRGA